MRFLALLLLASWSFPAWAGGRLLSPYRPPVVISGLPWLHEDAPVLRRLPARLKPTFREPVWALAQHTSGGRVRFRTDSTRLAVSGTNPDTSTMHHMTTVGQSGLDLYVDGSYRASAWPDKKGTVRGSWLLGSDRRMREVTVYLPLYNGIALGDWELDEGCRVEAPSPFALPGPVVHYGSSITQGGCAENPGLSYPAILGRRLNTDFVNLGFSGSGLGEPALADVIAETAPSAIVLDHWANPSPEAYQASLAPFLDILRRRHPKVPVLVTGPFWFPSEDASPELRNGQDTKRRAARDFVAARRKAGDHNVHFVDGLRMLGRAQGHGLVDGVHPNSLGFEGCADGLEPALRRVLWLRNPTKLGPGGSPAAPRMPPIRRLRVLNQAPGLSRSPGTTQTSDDGARAPRSLTGREDQSRQYQVAPETHRVLVWGRTCRRAIARG